MRYILFTSSNCQKCPKFRETVKTSIDFEGDILDEKQENFIEMITKYSVSAAPTIIIFDQDKEVFRTDDEYDLITYIQKNVN